MFPRFCTLSADQIQEICSCILLESKLWVRSVLFYRFELTDVMRTLITVLIMFPVLTTLPKRYVTSKKRLRGRLWLLKRCNKKLTLITETISAKALDKAFFHYTTD